MSDNDFGMLAMFEGLKKRGFVPDVVYDIGAAEGGWTRTALAYWPNSTFVCFEPLMERHRELTELAAEYPQVQLMFCGLADRNGEQVLGVTEDLYGSSFAYGGKDARVVQVQKLDTLISRDLIPAPDFMKLDVQGYERLVMSGGNLAVERAQLVLMECNFFPFCEAMTTLDQTIAFMSMRGFIPYEFVDYLRRPLDGAMGQCDILFVKKTHELVSNHVW